MKEWEKLQEDTKQKLHEVDGPARVTVGSGAVKGNGDVISKRLMIECKQRNRKNIIIDRDVWKKIVAEAELLDRVPGIVSMNESKEKLISLRLDDFCSMIG